MVQKVPDSGVTLRDIIVMEDLFSILFMILLERWQAGTILKLYIF